MTTSNVTIVEVARRAKVHPSTVSRALSPGWAVYVGEATRRRVLKVAEELGYRPNALAQGLRNGRTGVIGVVVVDFEHPFTAALLRGLEIALEAVGIMPLVTETHESSERLERALDHLLARRVDAIITTAARYGDAAIIDRAARQVPTVLAVRSLPTERFPTIAHDDLAGGALAGRHLLELGHRRIAELCGPLDVSSFVQRQEGFRAALSQGGVRELAFQMSAVSATLEEGKRIARALIGSADELPTAVFAHNDLVAVGAIDAFAEVGARCPRDVSIVGYDDLTLADHLVPPLTTIQLPSFHLGRLAAEMAYSLIQTPDTPPPTVSLPPTLVVRASTAAPPRTKRPSARPSRLPLPA